MKNPILAMSFKIILIFLFLCTIYCHAMDIIVCVKSSDSRSVGSQTGDSVSWDVECMENCSSISECNFSHWSSTTIILESGYHNIMQSSVLEFTERNKTAILGSIQGTTISCAPDIGLVFVNGNDVSISNIAIENCTFNYSTHQGNFASAILISGVRNVQLINITVSHSSGSAISLINIGGKVTVENSEFVGNIRSMNLSSSVFSIYYCVGCESSISVMNEAEVLITNSSIIGNSQGNIAFKTINNHMIVGLSISFDGCTLHVSITVMELVLSGLGKGTLVHFQNSSAHNSLTISSSCFFDIGYNIEISKYMHCHHVRGDFNPFHHAGGGIAVLFDGNSSYNTIVIEKSHFMNNTAFAGGGLFIAFQKFSHNNKARVVASTLSHNSHRNLVCGGGLAIYLFNSSQENSISINECKFNHNTALRGAGMYLQFQDSSSFNTFSVEKCTFVGNNSPDRMRKKDSGGGGLEGGYYFREKHAPIDNTVSIISCHFEENYADFGGGTLLFSSYAFRKDVNNSFYLIDCVWKNNSAIFGAAVDLTSRLTVRSHPPQGILPIPVFTNCTFEMNKVVNTDDSKGIGKGTFISTDMSARFEGSTIFDNCNGSAIHMTSGFLEFDEYSHVTFSNNNGSLGGAIDLVGRSSVLVQDHSRFIFINNSAVLNGGAISYFSTDRHSFASFRNCFIEYIGQTSDVNKRDIEFQFEGNTATVGSSIHASTVEHCYKHYNCAIDRTDLFNCIANFSFPENDFDSASYQLTTSGVKFIVNDSLLPLQVIPGKTFDVPIIMVDEFNHVVPSLYNLRIIKFYGNSSSFIPQNYARLFNTTRTKIYGNPGDHVELMVFHKDGLQERELKFNVSLQSCPPGYVIDKKSNAIPYNTCYCSYGIYVGMNCNFSNFQAKLLRGYWVGYDKGDEISENSLITGYCPEGYCNQASKTEYLLPSNTIKSELDQQVCATGRTGILCGRCSDNYSVYYHGWILRCFDNSNCSYGPTLYVLLELLPITIVFVIIIFFDVPITSGAANGFVLFCQVIDTLQLQANRFIWMPVPVYILNTISVRFIYKIFSLQFFTANDIETLKFLSFCLWKGSTGLGMLAFHYISLLYSLILVVVTVKVIDMCNIRKYCCECCFKLRRKQTVRGSITHGLTTFLLLCYSRFMQVSLMILIPGTLYSKHGRVTRQVVFYDGEVDFLSRQHLFYAVPALIVSIVLFLLPLLLTLYPAYYNIFSALGIGESRLLRVFCKAISIENLKPILDSFQGCFKDRFRFFAGLYFFYRLFALITFAYTSNLRVFYMIVEVQLVVMLMVHALVQPYKKRWHNAIDVMIFAILALINALTTFNFGRSFSQNNSKDISIISSIQAFLICLPGIYMLFYTTGYILIDVCGLRLKFKCCINMKALMKQTILPKCRQYFEKRSTTRDSAVELQSFYYSYED